MISTNKAVYAGAMFLFALALSGCTQKQSTDAQSTAAPAAETTAAPQATVAAQAVATAAALGPSLGISDGDQTGTKLVINSLARGSGTVTLKFSLVNDSPSELPTTRFAGHGYKSYRSFSGVHLIDSVSKKKYFAIADSDGNCVCSNDVADVAPKAQTSLWVKFPEPPASVKTITVEVPHFIPVDKVPIAQ